MRVSAFMGDLAKTEDGTRVAGRSPQGGDVYSYLDCARFVLAATVAFAHAWHLIVEDHRDNAPLWADIGYFVAGFSHASVILFFVLSGYWISRSVEQRIARGWVWRAYLSDRFARVAIVLVPALLLGGLLDLTGALLLRTPTHLGVTDTYVLRTDVVANLAWPVWLGNLALLQDIVVRPLGSNGPLWSLGWEWWFYLWYPALALSWQRRRPDTMLILMVLALIQPALLLAFACWLMGWLVRVIERRGICRTLLHSLPFALAAGAVFLGTLVIARFMPFPGWELPVAVAFAIFLAVLLTRRPAFPAVLTPVAHYGARASFSLYVTHFPILTMIAGLAVGSARLPPDMWSAALVAIGLATVIVFARGFAAVTEANTGRLRKAMAERLQARDRA